MLRESAEPTAAEPKQSGSFRYLQGMLEAGEGGKILPHPPSPLPEVPNFAPPTSPSHAFATPRPASRPLAPPPCPQRAPTHLAAPGLSHSRPTPVALPTPVPVVYFLFYFDCLAVCMIYVRECFAYVLFQEFYGVMSYI